VREILLANIHEAHLTFILETLKRTKGILDSEQ
jgi:hypothetical protein